MTAIGAAYPAEAVSTGSLSKSFKEIDLRINGIGMQSGYAAALKKPGKPSKIKKVRIPAGGSCYSETAETETTLIYPGLSLTFFSGKNPTVYEMEITSGEWTAAPGIKPGINPQILTARFGKPVSKDKYEGFDLFTYVLTDDSGLAQFYFKSGKLVKINWSLTVC